MPNLALSLSQRAAIMRLAHNHKYIGYVKHDQTRTALLRKGYIREVRSTVPDVVQLTQAGIRYYQTGKFIGE